MGSSTIEEIVSVDNGIKVRHGNDFNLYMYCKLDELLKSGHIKNLIKEPKYTMPGYTVNQFNPDFEITLLDDSKIIIDNTTSLRSDRIKQKQWDCYGVKKHFLSKCETVLFFIIIPDLSEKENFKTKRLQEYKNYKRKLNLGEIFSPIDDILQSHELLEMVKYSFI